MIYCALGLLMFIIMCAICVLYYKHELEQDYQEWLVSVAVRECEEYTFCKWFYSTELRRDIDFSSIVDTRY